MIVVVPPFPGKCSATQRFGKRLPPGRLSHRSLTLHLSDAVIGEKAGRRLLVTVVAVPARFGTLSRADRQQGQRRLYRTDSSVVAVGVVTTQRQPPRTTAARTRPVKAWVFCESPILTAGKVALTVLLARVPLTLS